MRTGLRRAVCMHFAMHFARTSLVNARHARPRPRTICEHACGMRLLSTCAPRCMRACSSTPQQACAAREAGARSGASAQGLGVCKRSGQALQSPSPRHPPHASPHQHPHHHAPHHKTHSRASPCVCIRARARVSWQTWPCSHVPQPRTINPKP